MFKKFSFVLVVVTLLTTACATPSPSPEPVNLATLPTECWLWIRLLRDNDVIIAQHKVLLSRHDLLEKNQYFSWWVYEDGNDKIAEAYIEGKLQEIRDRLSETGFLIYEVDTEANGWYRWTNDWISSSEFTCPEEGYTLDLHITVQTPHAGWNRGYSFSDGAGSMIELNVPEFNPFDPSTLPGCQWEEGDPLNMQNPEGTFRIQWGSPSARYIRQIVDRMGTRCVYHTDSQGVTFGAFTIEIPHN